MKRVIVVLFICMCSGLQARSTYILVSFRNCSLCNNIMRTVQANNIYIRNSILLGDPEESTALQLRNLAEENFGLKFKDVKVDARLYQQLARKEMVKLPYLVVAEKNNTVVFSIRIDSLEAYRDVLDAYLREAPQVTEKRIPVPRFYALGGYAHITTNKEYFVCNMLNKADRVYWVKKGSARPDSVCYSHDTTQLQYLLNLNGEQVLKAEDIMEIYNQYSLPFDLHRYGDLWPYGEKICMNDHLLYLDPNKRDSIWAPVWNQYFVTLNPVNGSTVYHLLKQWRDTAERPAAMRTLQVDDYYYAQVDDSMWQVGCKRLDATDAGMLNLCFASFRMQADGSVQPFDVRNIPPIQLKSFKGSLMNEEGFMYPYRVMEQLMYFQESPYVLLHNVWTDIRQYDAGIDWIFDMKLNEQGNLLRMAIRKNKTDYRLVWIDVSNGRKIKEVAFEQPGARSNFSLDDDGLWYLHKSGDIVQLKTTYRN